MRPAAWPKARLVE